MINNEEDLWRLFGGEDHIQPGRRSLSYGVVWQELHDYEAMHKGEATSAKWFKRGKPTPRTVLKDSTRFYVLIGRERQVCVDQSRLIKVGKAMRDKELSVQYLGVLKPE